MIEEKLNLKKGWFDLDESTELQSIIDLSNVSLEKLEFMKEIAAMNDDEFHAKAGAFKAVANIQAIRKKPNDEE